MGKIIRLYSVLIQFKKYLPATDIIAVSVMFNIFTEIMVMKKLFTILFLAFISSFFTTCEGQYTDLLNFNYRNGSSPVGNLIIAGNKLYGMTPIGGTDSGGVIFSIDTNGNGYKILLNFNGKNGAIPYGSLIISGGTLYGMANQGGADSLGLIFSIDTNGNKYKDILDFNGINGSLPRSSLILSGKTLYGMTSQGGADSDGVIFSIDTNGHEYKDLFDFNGLNGNAPVGDLTISGRKLYGMTPFGGLPHSAGNIFSIDTNGDGYKDLIDFVGPNGAEPQGNLVISDNKLYGMTGGGTYNSGAGNVFSIDTDGSGFNILVEFDTSIGSNPFGSLTFSGGSLYGMTELGSGFGGVIFSVDTSGNGFNDMFNFSRTNKEGEYPYNSLTLSGNMLYGMTQYGGADSNGVIFKFNYVTAGINNLIASNGIIKVYPNPSNGVFNFVLSHPELVSGSQTIEIYNVLGAKIYNETLKQVQGDNTINLSNQPNGIYLYRVLNENGGLIGEGKLIVQK